MKSKNKKLFLKIYIPFVIITIIALIVLQILGSKKRVGYLTDFNLEIYKTLELNNLNDIREEFTIDGKLDEESIKNYLLTNENITNYVHHFRIRYYDKVFRNNDIYGVYPDLSNLPDYMENAEMDEDGSPYGNFISDKKEIEEKIDNINYILKIKYYLYCVYVFLIFLTMMIILYILINAKVIEFGTIVFRIYPIFLVIFITFITILYFLTNKEYIGVISNFKLLYHTPSGYVYKGKLIAKKNLLFEYSELPLKLRKPDYIKNYGASIEITHIPNIYNYNAIPNYNVNSYYDSSNKCIVFLNSSTNNPYNYNLNTAHNEKYSIEIKAKTIIPKTNKQKIYYRLNYIDGYSYVSNTENILTNYAIYKDIKTINSYSGSVNENIDFIFPNDIINVEYIKIYQITDDLYLKNLSNDIVITTQDILGYSDKIENVSYKLNVNFNLYILLLLFIILYILLLAIHNKKILKLFNNKKIFLSFIFFIGLLLFIFQFWLCFPGYMFYGDTYTTMIQGIDGFSSNHFPIIISQFLHYLYSTFGYNTYYLYVLNLFLYYAGLILIISGIYLKYEYKYAIFIFLISFICNIFFIVINHAKDVTATLFVWFSYSIMFFIILLNSNKKIKHFLYFMFIIFTLIGMLWRHNMIVTIYPIFILITYKILNNIKLTKIKYLSSFVSLLILFAIISIAVVKIYPKLFVDEKLLTRTAANHLFMMQIAACAVPANDDSLIPKEWYNEGSSFDDVKKIYNSENPFFADLYIIYNFGNKPPFKSYNNMGIKKVWIKYILKYPLNYIKHLLRYEKNILTINTWKESEYNIQFKVNYDWHSIHNYYFSDIYDNDGITFSKTKYKIYSFLFSILIDINICIYVVLAIFLFFISGLLWFFKPYFRNEILLFSFCTSFSSFATSLIVSFTPIPLFRYAYPIIPMSILSLISFITFIYDRGGFKKFFKELRGEKK